MLLEHALHRLGRRAVENPRNRAQAVDRGDDHAGHGHRGDPMREIPQRHKDGQFAPEVGEARQADAGHRRRDEERRKHGRLLGEPAHLRHLEGARAVVDAGGQQEEQRHRQAVRDHEEHHAAGADGRKRRDAEEAIAHVHHRAVTQHLLEVALGHRHEADDQHVADRGEQRQLPRPVRGAERQQREGDLDEAVEAELLEHAGVQHGGRARGRAVAQRGPGVERPERNQDAEAEHQQAERVVLCRGVQALRGDRLLERDQVEGVGAALHVERDQAEQRQHRTNRQVDGHLHRRVVAVASAPDANHDERRDQRQFVEEIEEKDVHRGEHAEQAAVHDEQQHEV